jgi:hypothetical protein
MYRAIASSTAFVSLRSARSARALSPFSIACNVAGFLPFPSRCESKSSILGSSLMYWTGSSVRIKSFLASPFEGGAGSAMGLLDRAPAS